MSEFKNKSITTKGLELLSKAMTGGKLEFTRIEMGSGNFSGDVSSVESLVEVKQNLQLTNIVRKGGQVTLSAILKIEDITSEYDWTEIGVYAKGSDEVEVLYMYGYTINSSFISNDSLNEKLINVTVIVSSVAEVTAVINSSVVYLTRETLEEHNTSDSAHSDIRKLIKQLQGEIENIDVSWEGITGKPSTFPPSEHTHDDRYYTKTEMNTKLNGKANTSHAHTKSQITDFPTSLPANGGNADTLDGKHASDFASNTHGHTVSQIIGFPTSLPANGGNAENANYANNSGKLSGYTYEQIKKLIDEAAKKGGDYMGKDMVLLGRMCWLTPGSPFTYTNSKGGILRVTEHSNSRYTITVDGRVVASDRSLKEVFNTTSYGANIRSYELIIPFNSSVSFVPTLIYHNESAEITLVAYINK